MRSILSHPQEHFLTDKTHKPTNNIQPTQAKNSSRHFEVKKLDAQQ